MSKALFILGMHRSGTSALARVLNLCGVELGGRLMAAAGDNERGFWEHEGAVQIHEDLLRQLGHQWCDGTPLPEGWLESEAAVQAQMQLAGLIDLDFLTQPLWGIKDPRLSLLFPLWLPLLKERGVEPLCIIAWRNPLEVAASLQKRDHLAQDAALLCWLAYTIESLRHAQNFPHVVLGYEELLTDWRAATDKVATGLNLSWPRRDEAEIEAFLAPELRHHQNSEFRIQSSVGEMAAECLRLLQQPEAGAIDRLHQQWSDYCAPFAPLLRQARREAAEQSDRAGREAHKAKDLRSQLEKLYDEYTATLEREKEALVQSQMVHAGLRHAEEKLLEMEESTSWKVTEPLRRVKKMIGESE